MSAAPVVETSRAGQAGTLGLLLAKTLGRVPIAGSEVEILRNGEPGVVLRADRLEGRRNRVSHVLAWEAGDRRGARAGVGTEDEDDALEIHAEDGETPEDEGRNAMAVAEELARLMPLSPPLYPAGELTDEPETVRVAELIREAALEDVRDELPHSIAVTVEEMLPREGRPEDRPLTDVHATIHVERDSQKAIIIGRGGSRLKQIGSQAREGIRKLLGTPVYLDLHVKVTKEWQRDAKKLGRLGF